MKRAFTILEILFALGVVAVLALIAIPASNGVSRYAARVKSLSNLRQIGVASHLYANDHQQELPGAAPAGDAQAERWPTLLCGYLTPSDPRVFLDPADRSTAALPIAQVLSNTQNNTGYIYNGFDEMNAADGAPPAAISLTQLDHPSTVVLMSQKTPGVNDFYVHLLTEPISALLNLLNPKAFDNGAHYLFADGSVRYLKQAEYNDRLWLLEKGLSIPGLPDVPPLLPGLRPGTGPESGPAFRTLASIY